MTIVCKLLILVSCFLKVQSLNIRLAENDPTSGPHWGRVEVSEVTDVWGTVSHTGWTDNDALVVCKQLGFATGQATPGSQTSNRRIFMKTPGCGGSEANLGSCPGASVSDYGWKSSSDRYAAVICFNDNGPQIRLNPGPNYGLVEIAINGVWGTVCHHSTGYEWNRAIVVCKQLGYHNGYGYYITQPKPRTGNDTQPIWLYNSKCSGSESSLFDCPHYGWGTGWYHCSGRHQSDMNVMCFTNQNSVFVENGFNYGRLNYWLAGSSNKWKRQICDEGWDDDDAKVACKSMGFSGGKAFTRGTFHSETWGASYGLSNFQCDGTETSLWDCSYTSTSSCASHGERSGKSTAGALCFDEANTYVNRVTLNVQPTTGKYGHVLLTYYNAPGMICDPDWTTEDALVTCKTYAATIGYENFDAGIPLCCGLMDQGDQRLPIWKKHINCTGSETNLLDCPMDEKWGEHYPDPDCLYRDSEAYVVCYTSTNTFSDDFMVRIMDGDNKRYGHVFVNYKTQWGTVSADPGVWTDVEASVVCRQLEYNGVKPYAGGISAPGRMWRHHRKYAQWLKNVTCEGTENSLTDCPYAAGYGDNFWKEDREELHQQGLIQWYSHNKDVGVVCYEENEDLFANWRVTIERGKTFLGQTYGLVFVEYARLKGTICSNGFDDVDAQVVCREAGYKIGAAKPYYSMQHVMNWMNNLRCNGSEPGILNCSHDGFGGHDSCQQHNTYGDAAVFCSDAEEYYQEYRLNGGRSNYGYVELDFAGHLGTVCHNYWGWHHARALCHEFGYVYDFGRHQTHSHAGRGIGPVYMEFSNTGCPPNGPGFSLFDCPTVLGFGWTHCGYRHDRDAGVFCYDNYDRCIGHNDISGDEGIIKTSYQDHNYLPNSDCSWRITVSKPYRVVLTFFRFWIVDSSNCQQDFVQAFDPLDNNQMLSPGLCGFTKPGPIRSISNQMLVNFKSDGTSENRGFVAVFHKECVGLQIMVQTEVVTNITGTSFKKLKNANLDLCTIKCDMDWYCREIYYDETNGDCYLKMRSYHGRNWTLANLIVRRYVRQCIPCTKRWYDLKMGVLLQNSLNKTVEDVLSLTECKAECEGLGTCVSVSYSPSLKRCILNFATRSENGSASEVFDGEYNYTKIRCEETENIRSCVELKHLKPQAESGWYLINMNNVLTPIYCDLSSTTAWMMVLSVTTSTWSADKLIGASQPSLVDYSILSLLDDHVKAVSESDYFSYRIDADGSTYGQWTSHVGNSFLASKCQNKTRLTFVGSENHDQVKTTLSRCLPYLKRDEGILTTSDSATPSLGALTRPSTGFLDPNIQPTNIRYYIKETISNEIPLFSPCKRLSTVKYHPENGTYTCLCLKNTYGKLCENRDEDSPAGMTVTTRRGKLICVKTDLISSSTMRREIECIAYCSRHLECKSVNFKQTASGDTEPNCECLKAEAALAETDPNQIEWKHFSAFV